MWKCLHGINMVKDHSITYQRDRGTLQLKKDCQVLG